jgi:PAS domain-containing protein
VIFGNCQYHPIAVSWRTLHLSNIIEKIPLAVIVTRPNGWIDYANSQAHLLLDMPEGSLRARDVTDFRTSSHFLRQGWADGTSEFAKWRDEARYCTGRGRQVRVLETLWPVHDEAGEVSCFIHFLQTLHVSPVLPAHFE